MGIIIKCAYCGKEKEKSGSHYNWAIKHCQKMYCSNTCSATAKMPKLEIEINQETVKNLFDYHPDGYLIWKNPTNRRVKIGAIVGHKQLFIYPKRQEYRWVVRLNNKLYFLHKIIFLWHHGYMPKITDHRDRNQLNNRIENLREATISQNGCNRKPRGSSKYLGVHLDKQSNKWVACIKMNGKQTYLGSFQFEEDAAICYNEKAKIIHGEFANLNIVE